MLSYTILLCYTDCQKGALMKKYHPVRSKESVQISITVPKELLKQIDDITLVEDRNRSNMITVILRNGIANYNAKAAAQAALKGEPDKEAK